MKAYPYEIRSKAVKMYTYGQTSRKEIGRKLGIPFQTISYWIKKASSEQPELSRRQLHDLLQSRKRMEDMVAVLKSVACSVQAPLQVRLNELERLYGKFDTHVLCDALDVPRGTFLNHIKRNKKDKKSYVARRQELSQRILEIHDKYRQRLGAGKIAAILRDEGFIVSKEMVHELMTKMNISSIRTQAKDMYMHLCKNSKNLVARQFNAPRPNAIWVSDVTEFRFKNVTVFICAVMDLFARKIVGCKFSHSNSTHLITMTFRQAYNARQQPKDLIFHSDRGGNYRSQSFRLLLNSLGVAQSFSKPYTPYDNSVMESFFKTLKAEELYRSIYRSEEELKDAVMRYMEFYNGERPHKALDYITPNQKESNFFAKAE
jgi:transposase InsO family protein/transposase-like protein